MPTMKKPPSFLESLETALISGLNAAGIRAKVDWEPVPTTKLWRLMVVASKFAALKHYERQDLVWRIASQTLDRDQQLMISMIITMTPDEAAGR